MKQEYKKERVFFASYVHSRERQEFRQVFFFVLVFHYFGHKLATLGYIIITKNVGLFLIHKLKRKNTCAGVHLLLLDFI